MGQLGKTDPGACAVEVASAACATQARWWMGRPVVHRHVEGGTELFVGTSTVSRWPTGRRSAWAESHIVLHGRRCVLRGLRGGERRQSSGPHRQVTVCSPPASATFTSSVPTVCEMSQTATSSAPTAAKCSGRWPPAATRAARPRAWRYCVTSRSAQACKVHRLQPLNRNGLSERQPPRRRRC